ncbi:CHRD domain-containing protein [Cupriavidus sp. 30B13]|uniref:CHRD domain-containing protein n=1 Tax=Cupriavidus sp. 30B13 TaxID=3384241 RepID=UPI003B9138D0
MRVSIRRPVRRSLRRHTLAGFAGLAFAAALSLAQAAPVSFNVPLTGAQQVPPVQTPGSGSADLTYDPATRVVTWTVSFSGLSSAPTMAHFHGPAVTGKNAGVQVWLAEKGAALSSPVKGQATLSPAEAKEFVSGEMYINVHTKDHPAGEIRGQVLPPKSN